MKILVDRSLIETMLAKTTYSMNNNQSNRNSTIIAIDGILRDILHDNLVSYDNQKEPRD